MSARPQRIKPGSTNSLERAMHSAASGSASLSANTLDQWIENEALAGRAPPPGARVPEGGFGALLETQGATDEIRARLIEAALALGADASMRGPGGETALAGAARQGNLLCVEALLPWIDPRAANDNGCDALQTAARAGQARAVDRLLPLCDPLSADPAGKTALMTAAERGHPECVRLLLPHSDARTRERSGFDALGLAAGNGHKDAVAELASHCDATIRSSQDGYSPLMLAAKRGDAGVVAVLLGVSRVDDTTDRGLTALMLAAMAGSLECVRLLLPASDATKTASPNFFPSRLGRPDAFALAVDRECWPCADFLARGIEAERLREALEAAPPGAMPQAMALVEQSGLLAAISPGKTESGAKNGSEASDGSNGAKNAAEAPRGASMRL
jgi:ankyrin repeat protein